MAAPRVLEILQNYAPQCEAAVNRQINMEFHAAYVFQMMGYCFQREDRKLVHFSHYFLRLSREAWNRAEKLMDLQVERGVSFYLHSIQKPPVENWESGLQAMEHALKLEKDINQGLLHLHRMATSLHDGHLCGFLETHFLLQVAESIKELTNHTGTLRKMGAPGAAMSEYFFQHFILREDKKRTEPERLSS